MNRKYDGPPSSFAFRCNLRHYSKVGAAAAAAKHREAAALTARRTQLHRREEAFSLRF